MLLLCRIWHEDRRVIFVRGSVRILLVRMLDRCFCQRSEEASNAIRWAVRDMWESGREGTGQYTRSSRGLEGLNRKVKLSFSLAGELYHERNPQNTSLTTVILTPTSSWSRQITIIVLHLFPHHL